MATSSGIIQSFLRDSLNLKKDVDDLRFKDLLAYNRDHSEHRSNDFLPSLNFYLDILDNTDKVMFDYMSSEQKEQLRFDLKITLLLLLAQQQHEIDYQQTENTKKYRDHIKQCAQLLAALDPVYKKALQKNPVLEETTAEMPVKYLGFAVGQELAKEMLGYQGGISKNLNEFAGRVNEKRLYWVWGSTFVKTMIDLVPKDYFYAAQAPGILGAYSDPLAGILSCGLYYARFALSFGLLFKHTIRHPWMSDEEAKMPWTERFLTQWEQRKFGLLNDSIWGTANLLSFIWLNSKHSLGAWGDALTVVLLIFDISVAIWDFEEQKTKYNKEMLQFNKDIERLNDDIHEIKHQIGMNEQEQKAKVHQMQMQINALKRAQAKCEREWQLQKIALITNISYAVGLTLTFIVLTMPFVPLSAPVAATLALVGAIVCLAFTVINNAIKGGLEIHRTRHTLKDLEKDYNAYVLKFRETPEGMERKLLFLEIKKLDASTDFQQNLIVYQSVSLARSIMLEVFTPAIILASLIFLSLGVGAIPIGAALGMAIATHFMIDALFKPEEQKELAPFNGNEYEEFCKFTNQLNPEKNSEKIKFSFFKPTVKDNLKDDRNDLDYLPSKE